MPNAIPLEILRNIMWNLYKKRKIITDPYTHELYHQYSNNIALNCERTCLNSQTVLAFTLL